MDNYYNNVMVYIYVRWTTLTTLHRVIYVRWTTLTTMSWWISMYTGQLLQQFHRVYLCTLDNSYKDVIVYTLLWHIYNIYNLGKLKHAWMTIIVLISPNYKYVIGQYLCTMDNYYNNVIVYIYVGWKLLQQCYRVYLCRMNNYYNNVIVHIYVGWTTITTMSSCISM